MNNTEKAQAIKKYLVGLATSNLLPTDMNGLDIEPILEILGGTAGEDLDYDLQRAEDLLAYDHDFSSREMVEQIRNYPNQDALIDDVEGVVVWEKVEYSFTCKQFMQEISKPIL